MFKKVLLFSVAVFCFLFVQNVSFAQSKYESGDYLDNLENLVKKNWILPLNPKDKSSLVSFTVDKDGYISNIELTRSSKDKEFDKSSMNAVKKTALHRVMEQNYKTLYIQFYFSPKYTHLTLNNYLNPMLKNSNIVNVANNTSNVDFSDYTESLQKQIDSNWTPKSLKKSRDAVARIQIGKDGSLNDVKFVKLSDSILFDLDIYDAISKSVPLEVLPANFRAESANVQLTFNYEKLKKQHTCEYNVKAVVNPVPGYDKYKKEIEKVISNKLASRRLVFKKDIILEISINKNGNLKYVKATSPTKSKMFNREIIFAIQQMSFPPIPDELGIDNITINYEVVTRGSYFFESDFYLSPFLKRLTSFCI